VVRARLADAVVDARFDRGVIKLVQALQSEPEKLARLRAELDAIIGEFFADNTVHQHYLMTRAIKRAA
jgi:hypothetical protein